MKRNPSLTGFLLALFFAWMPLAKADLVFTIQEVGSDVVATGSGDLDTTGLSLLGTNSSDPFTQPSIAALVVGSIGNGDFYDAAADFVGPSDFGTGLLLVNANSGSGDPMGISVGGGNLVLVVRESYGSGDPLSGTATWLGTSVASLGMTQGTYLWTLDANGATVTINVVPEPTTTALLVSTTAALGFVAYRRRARVSR